MNAIIEAALLFSIFIVALFAASKWLPGREVTGAPMPNGAVPRYRLNGFTIFLALLVLVAANFAWGSFRLARIAELFWPLFWIANVFSVALTLWLHVRASNKDPVRWRGLWFGDAYNPAWLGVDLKLFAYRPSLMGLAILNLALADQQLARYGQITLAMALYQVMTLFYLLSTFEYEEGLLSMWDMVEEKFGFMLVWGDLVYVPFFYCISGFFLVDYLVPMSPLLAVALSGLYIFGFWLFRGANAQKNRFKRRPDARIWGKKPKTIDGRLLVSGFWGVGRKLNYTGEILLYCAWTLTVRTASPWPYLLPLSLMVLLAHRARRDDRRCRRKYGELWDRYCAKVRFRMLPFVY